MTKLRSGRLSIIPAAEPSPVREAAVIESDFLLALAAMLRQVDAKVADATA